MGVCLYLWVTHGYEDVVKEVLYLLVEERGRVHRQLPQDQHLRGHGRYIITALQYD